MAIKISGTTVIDDSRSLQNISGGAILGIQSAGVTVGSGATVLNFIGAGNTFAYDPGSKTLSISIQGGGGGTGVGGTYFPVSTRSGFIQAPTLTGVGITLTLRTGLATAYF